MRKFIAALVGSAVLTTGSPVSASDSTLPLPGPCQTVRSATASLTTAPHGVDEQNYREALVACLVEISGTPTQFTAADSARPSDAIICTILFVLAPTINSLLRGLFKIDEASVPPGDCDIYIFNVRFIDFSPYDDPETP